VGRAEIWLACGKVSATSEYFKEAAIIEFADIGQVDAFFLGDFHT
jgi:hypothetical protein